MTMTARKYGTKHDPDLSVKEIAVKLREEFKADTDLRRFKISVRSDFNSIDVRVTKLPNQNPPFKIANRELLAGDEQARFGPSGRFTTEAKALLDKLNEMMNAYNYDGSDLMTDHFDVNFYGGAEFSGLLDEADRQMAERERATERERVEHVVAEAVAMIAPVPAPVVPTAAERAVLVEAAEREVSEAQTVFLRASTRLAKAMKALKALRKTR